MREIHAMSAIAYEHLKAFIVEDNQHMRLLLKSLLHALGLKQVYEAPDCESGFAMLRECRPDFVLTDPSMKPMDGLEFTRRARTAQGTPNPYVPIIMVTGHTERERITAARDAGVTEILAKPITAQNLMLRIAKVVDAPRAFVRTEAYFGPDRRRRNLKEYAGPWRRCDDVKQDVAVG